MCKTDQECPQSPSEKSLEDSEYELSAQKQYKGKKKVKRIHKIPINVQQQLFRSVFHEGKQIKQVAEDLKINYSSAKSLIHYYKQQKRPAPVQVVAILNGRKPAHYRQVCNSENQYNNLKIELRLNKDVVSSYYYYAKLKQLVQC